MVRRRTVLNARPPKRSRTAARVQQDAQTALAKKRRLAFPWAMTSSEKSQEARKRAAQAPREERLAAALRENLRRRKEAAKRAAIDDGEDDEGPVDDRD